MTSSDPAATMTDVAAKALALAVRITLHDADGQLRAADFTTPADCTARLAAAFEAFAEAVVAAARERAGSASPGGEPSISAKQDAMDEVWGLRVTLRSRDRDLGRAHAEIATLRSQLAAVPSALAPAVLAWAKAPPEQHEAVRELLSLAAAGREQAANRARSEADRAALGRIAAACRAALAALDGLTG